MTSLKRDDKKSPGTYFEILAGHLFAREFGVNPVRSIEVLGQDLRAKLPTDNIFDLGQRKAKIHAPVKISTRERVIQVWAHQRVLDGVYGQGRYKGVLVILTETKRSEETREVVEICLPDQWTVYQMHIAQLHRIYYLDLPKKYAELGQNFPRISVKPLGEFFFEKEALLGPEK